jgi:hypothetical protein
MVAALHVRWLCPRHHRAVHAGRLILAAPPDRWLDNLRTEWL